MKRAFILTLLLGALASTRAQDDAVSLPDIVQGVHDWAQENLDTNFLNSLPEVDQQKVQPFLRDLQRQFQGEYIINLAPLRDIAQTVLPILENNPDTRPYASWLKARLDYLQFADELRVLLPPPEGSTNQPPPVSNPPPQKERDIWVTKTAKSPWPNSAKALVPQLKPIFAAQQIPGELVWIAEAESAFDANARSPAGAAGLFQLMPDTAKRFGLSLWPRDERFQPAPSAHASAQYLKSLHDQFGDWRLALAAYNAGEGAVQKLIQRYKTRNYDDLAPHLPAETQMYVPRIEAILLQREGTSLDKLGSIAPDHRKPT